MQALLALPGGELVRSPFSDLASTPASSNDVPVGRVPLLLDRYVDIVDNLTTGLTRTLKKWRISFCIFA